jgi:hypothetical protein
VKPTATRREFLGSAGAAALCRTAASRCSNVRALFAFDAGVDPEKFAASCSDWGIRQAILAPSFFRDERFARALAGHRVDLWFNLPVFYNREYLAQHPEHYAITSRGRKAIHDWCHFVCPSRKEYLDTLVRDLRVLLPTLQPAIVSLDFIRHFVFWEEVDLHGDPSQIEHGCYCPLCLRGFEKFCGQKVDRNQPAVSIRSSLKAAWADWKCSQVSTTADMLFGEIRTLAKDAQRSIKLVPWKEQDLDGAIRNIAGQDVPRLARHVDVTAPMAFTQVLGQNPAWKRELLHHVRKITAKPVLSYLQTDRLIRPEEITVAQFESELQEALAPEWAGVTVFEYGQLAANPVKAGILRKCLKGS